MSPPPIYTNPKASTWTFPSSIDPFADPSSPTPQSFHQTLANFTPTSLIPLPHLAGTLHIHSLFVKSETDRLGLPAFKILGASWGTFRALVARSGGALSRFPVNDVAEYARASGVVLFTATDGNHGRAVARMAKILGVNARVFVPWFTGEMTRELIAGEGAKVEVVKGDYDAAVAKAYQASKLTDGGLFVQDTSFKGYEEIPAWIVEGYSTMLQEIEQQLEDLGLKASAVVTPIGVGSLGHAVVAHCKSKGRGIQVLAVEPERAACLQRSLKAGHMVTIDTSTTIMDGMNCGSVSSMSWPLLQAGVDASVTVSEMEAHRAVEYLHAHSVPAGPCGAGPLAGLQKVAREDPTAVRLTADAVVVLLCTEGTRDYMVPSTS